MASNEDIAYTKYNTVDLSHALVNHTPPMHVNVQERQVEASSEN